MKSVDVCRTKLTITYKTIVAFINNFCEYAAKKMIKILLKLNKES